MYPDVPTIDSVDAAAYRVPTGQPESDGTLSWDATTLVTVEAAGRCGPIAAARATASP